MISPASFNTSTYGAESAGGRSALGKDEFLRLLVTQLKNQDPLSPLQPHEFAAQLAQFTSVEQLTQVNAGIAQQSELTQLAALVGKTTFGAALIGRQVVAEGNQVIVPATGGARVKIDVGGTGGKATLRVLDKNGREVGKSDLGSLGPGRQTLSLPPGIPPGTYTYRVDVKDAKDHAVPVTTYTVGTVDGVFFKNGQIVLRLGSIEIELDRLAEIETAPTTTTATNTRYTTPLRRPTHTTEDRVP
jgi:flagellar basal-body rod modification protein FlgD